MASRSIDKALQKGAHGERLTAAEALALIDDLSPDAVHQLGRAALSNRIQRFGHTATYVFNLQINPSNICSSGCSFCNYAASPGDEHAYVLEEAEILREVVALEPVEVHIVGGLNTVWPYQRNLELVAQLRRRFPLLHIKAFTAVEIAYFAHTTRKEPLTILEELKAAGMDAMPGGGAEIFSEALHQCHWKNKIGPAEWLRIHGQAHNLGIPSNATMLFGIGESWGQRLEHLLRLRAAQEQSGGFTCFIPLAFQPGRDGDVIDRPAPLEILAVMALSRLVLDNIAHIKSYWPMTGLATAAAGLSWGADDMDGTIRKERIAHLAGAKTPKGLAREQMQETIRMAGFDPVERDGRFQPCGVLASPSPLGAC